MIIPYIFLANCFVLNHNGQSLIIGSTNLHFSPSLLPLFNRLYGAEISKSIITANSQSKITTEKGPVMLLYELFTDISFSCTQTIGPQHAKFKTQVTVNGVEFEGTGE